LLVSRPDGDRLVLPARGFSAVELMTVLAIVAILVTIAVPGFRRLLQAHRLTTVTNELFMAINLTRSEALQRSARVDLVPADGRNWNSGWIVFVDGNRNRLPDAGDIVVFTRGPAPSGISIESRFRDSRAPYLAYAGNGRTRTHANANTPQSGSFLLRSEHASRRITVGFLGRPRVCNPATGKSTC
jgi:type IV fimbrial biogenesis protein FimT